MKRIFEWVAWLALGLPTLAISQNATFIVHGSVKHCNDLTQLDSALSNHFEPFFRDWSVFDYDTAVRWSSECSQYGWQSVATSRVSLLQARQLPLREAEERKQTAEAAALAQSALPVKAAPIKHAKQITPKPPSAVEVPESEFIEHGSYTNVNGDKVHSPTHTIDGEIPMGATAECRDGSYSFSQHRRGTCSHHGGVADWL